MSSGIVDLRARTIAGRSVRLIATELRSGASGPDGIAPPSRVGVQHLPDTAVRLS